MRMICTIFQLDALAVVRTEFSDFVSITVMKQVRWNPKNVVVVVEKALKCAIDLVNKMPQELLLVFRALNNCYADTLKTRESQEVAVSILFLRFFCPCLVNKSAQDSLTRSLVQVAKMLQLVANKANPQKDAFCYPVKDLMEKQHKNIDKLARAIKEVIICGCFFCDFDLLLSRKRIANLQPLLTWNL